MEVALFLGVGVVAVFAAMMMLLEENAVHSALFLIVNFLCVAILYLMLDAPFLAMIQIAVYAGAIMVLFLFVIMLLGAEYTGEEDTKLNYRGISLAAIVLAVIFVLVMAGVFIQGDIDNREIPEDQPLVRVFNFARDLTPSDFYLNGELISAGPEFTVNADELADVEFVPVEAGEVTFGTLFAGEDPGQFTPDPLEDFVLEAETAYTVIVYGEGDFPDAALVETPLEATDTSERTHLVVFNAAATLGPVALADIGSDFLISEGEEVTVVVPDVPFGEASEPIDVEAGSPDWGVVTIGAPTGEEETPDVSLIHPLREFDVDRSTSQLIVVAERELVGSEGLSPVVVPVAVNAEFAFGSPQTIGESLFIQYVLPFEMVAILLLAAMVGAIVLTQRGDVKPKPGRPLRRRVSRPLTAVIASQTGGNVLEGVPELEQPEAEEESAETGEDSAGAEPAGE